MMIGTLIFYRYWCGYSDVLLGNGVPPSSCGKGLRVGSADGYPGADRR